jgi:hypothetical protein
MTAPAVTAAGRKRARDDDHRVTVDGRIRAREKRDRRAFRKTLRKALAEKQADERRELQLHARRYATQSATVCCDCARPLAPTDTVTMVSRNFGRNYDRFVALCLLCTLGALKPLFGRDHPIYFFREEMYRRRCQHCGRPMRVIGKFFAARYCCDNCRTAHRLESNKLRRRVKPKPKTCLKCGESFTPTRADAVTCSNACRQALHRERTSASASDSRNAEKRR